MPSRESQDMMLAQSRRLREQADPELKGTGGYDPDDENDVGVLDDSRSIVERLRILRYDLRRIPGGYGHLSDGVHDLILATLKREADHADTVISLFELAGGECEHGVGLDDCDGTEDDGRPCAFNAVRPALRDAYGRAG